MQNYPDKIIVHCTATPKTTTWQSINNYHKQRGFSISTFGLYVGYHILIQADGNIKWCRTFTDVGCHTIGQNFSSIGIGLIFNGDEELPTPQQEITLTELLKQLCSKFKISPNNIFPHRLFANKSCYGKLLSDNWARGLYYKKYNPLVWFLWAKWIKPNITFSSIQPETDYEDW